MQGVISKAECKFRTCHFILNTEPVSIKWHLSMFSNHRIVFLHYGHSTVPFPNLMPASKNLSLRTFAHTYTLGLYLLTSKGTSLLSAEVIMQPRNSPCSRKEAEEQLYFKGNFKNNHTTSSIATLTWKLSDLSFSTLNNLAKYEIAKTKLRSLDGTYLIRNSLKFTAPGGCCIHAALQMTL